jgi:hypothetical protein
MKKALLISAFAFVNLFSYGQLDSSSMEINFLEEYTNPADSLILYDVAVMTLTLDDVSDLGKLSVVVYDNSNDNLLLELVYTRQELIDAGFIQSTGVVLPLVNSESGQSYKIEVNPENIAGANTRMCSLIVSN